jgi:CheY-like chemotaxis protein
MAHVLVVHESPTVRSDLRHALLAEGFTVAEADSGGAAVRELWSGSFDAALVSPQLPKVSGTPVEDHLKGIAPEIVTVAITRDSAAKQAKRLTDILDGAVAA